MIGINILGLVFNNYCLQYVDASFHQVARGLVLPFTIVVTIVVLHQWPSNLSLTAAIVVTLGFFAGVFLDPNHASSAASQATASTHSASLGIMFGAISSIASALHAVLIKRSLNIVSGSALGLSYYNNILSTLALIPIVIISGEGPGVVAMFFEGDLRTFIWGAAITGLFGFLISLAAFISIKVTSPVTHMISSAARGVLQTVIAVWLFGDIMSGGRVMGIFLIISGSVLYVYSKSVPEGPKKPDSTVIPLDPRSVERGPQIDEEMGEK